MFFAKPWADALIVLLVVLLFFGPKRLPSLGRSLGEGMREFKDSITGKSGSDDEEAEVPAVSETSASAAPVTTTPPAEPQATPEAAPAAPQEAPAPQSPPVASSERRS
jgi:sec-independent protein translocase protein TatA